MTKITVTPALELTFELADLHADPKHDPEDREHKDDPKEKKSMITMAEVTMSVAIPHFIMRMIVPVLMFIFFVHKNKV